MKLIVKNTGILEMDQNVLHPFVRIHIVDMNTNKYLAKDKPSVPGVSNIENCSFFRYIPGKVLLKKGDLGGSNAIVQEVY